MAELPQWNNPIANRKYLTPLNTSTLNLTTRLRK